MKRYQTVCLVFVGAFLAIGATHASVGWLRCTQSNGGMVCRSFQSDAVAGWSLAANALQGIAFQENK
jgi:hypothetical protein